MLNSETTLTGDAADSGVVSAVGGAAGRKDEGRWVNSEARSSDTVCGELTSIGGKGGTMRRGLLLFGLFVLLLVRPVGAQVSPSSDIGLQCEVSKDGAVVASPSLRIAAGETGTITLGDELKVTFKVARIDAHQVRVAVDTKTEAGANAMTLTLRDQEAGTATIPAGKATFGLKVSVLK